MVDVACRRFGCPFRWVDMVYIYTILIHTCTHTHAYNHTRTYTNKYWGNARKTLNECYTYTTGPCVAEGTVWTCIRKSYVQILKWYGAPPLAIPHHCQRSITKYVHYTAASCAFQDFQPKSTPKCMLYIINMLCMHTNKQRTYYTFVYSEWKEWKRRSFISIRFRAVA